MNSSTLAGLRVESGATVRIMGVINASPESFFKPSVHATAKSIAAAARRMAADGADFIDVGAMSTAPYLKTKISEIEEARRLAAAIRVVRRSCKLPISADTSRFLPARAALESGAAILNDVTGLRNDPRLLAILPKYRGLIVMAHPMGLAGRPRSPVQATIEILRASIQKARAAGFPVSKIVADPGIGFFRETGRPWWRWDLEILRELDRLKRLRVPLLVGVSRKSFLGKVLNEPNPEKRLAGSLAATAAAVLNGASIIRTHDVRETLQAVRLAEKLKV